MNNLKFGYLIFGAIFGASMAMLASRKNLAYAVQSGEGAGGCAKRVMKRDEETFRDEVASAQ
jgi:hypothetical protein